MHPDNLPGMFGGESIWDLRLQLVRRPGYLSRSRLGGGGTCRAVGLAEAEPVAP